MTLSSSTAGALRVVDRYQDSNYSSSPGGVHFASNDMAIDAEGNRYSVGMYVSSFDADPTSGVDMVPSSASESAYLTKINADGTYAWTKTWTASQMAIATSVAIDNNNAIVVGGVFVGTVDFDDSAAIDNHSSVSPHTTDIFVTKLSSDGTYLWTKTVGGVEQDGPDVFLAINDQNDITFSSTYYQTIDLDPGAGTVNHTNNGSDSAGFVVTLDENGLYKNSFVTGQRADIVSSVTTLVGGLATDSQGVMYVAGTVSATGPSATARVAFDPNGVDQQDVAIGSAESGWILRINADGSYGGVHMVSYSDQGLFGGIAVDSNDQVHVLGTATSSSSKPIAFMSNSATPKVFMSSSATDGYYAYHLTLNNDFSYNTHTATGAPQAVIIVKDIMAGDDGQLYVTGLFSSPGAVDFDSGAGVDNKTPINSGFSVFDRFITKYTADGSYAWTRHIPAQALFESGGTLAKNAQGTLFHTASLAWQSPGGGTFRINDDPVKDVTIGAGGGAIYSLQLQEDRYYNTINVAPGLAVTAGSVDVSNEANGGVLADQSHTVVVKKSANNAVIAEIDLTLGDDDDWSDVSADVDLTGAKSFAHGLTSTVGSAATFSLYVPYQSRHNAVGICPSARSLGGVSENCTDLYYLDQTSDRVEVVQVGGHTYWKISGLSGTGGFGASRAGVPNTGLSSYGVTNGVVLLLLSGVVSYVGYRLRGTR